MKRNFLMIVAGLGIIAVLATGCAKKPNMEIDAAKAGVEAAKAAEANRYLPAEFNALQDSLNSAMNMVEEQNSKFGLFRNYKKAKTKLEGVVTLASNVKENSSIKKEEVKTEVQNSLTEASSLVEEVKTLIAKAPRGKEGKAAIEAIQGDLAIVEASLTEVSTLINNGDYLTAQDKVNAAIQKADDLKMELEEVIAKVRK